MNNRTTGLKNLCFFLGFCLLVGCSKKKDEVSAPAATTVILRGTISTDRILVNGPASVDYFLEEIVNLEAKLTIEPGTIIVAKAGSGLSINTSKGVVVAVGKADNPITIRSESGSKGGWLGIKFNGSNNPLNELTYVTIKDGGSTSFDGDDSKKANIQFAGINQLKMTNCTISNSANWGIYETFSSDLTLNGFANNQFKSNTNFPLYLFDQTAIDIGNASLFTDNGRNFIGLRQKASDGLVGANIWQKQAVPYFWDDTDNLVVGYYKTNGNLTLEAGAQLVMGPGSGIVVGANANNTGFLKLMGNAIENVVIKGEMPTKGFWKGILIKTNSPNNDFQNASVSDAGSTNLSSTGSKANVVAESGATIKMTNVNLSNSAGCGYTVKSSGLTRGVVNTSAMTYTNNAGGNNCTF
jgi:hypothetical protein